jgi:hypothetical protein
MQDEDSVVFRLSPPVGKEKTALPWFVEQLEDELESRGIRPIGKKLSDLSYGVLSYPASHGHISVFVLWPDRSDLSSWQIRTLYFRPWLRRILRAQPTQKTIAQMECFRDWIQRFLLTHDASQIQWMSAADAEERLRQECVPRLVCAVTGFVW